MSVHMKRMRVPFTVATLLIGGSLLDAQSAPATRPARPPATGPAATAPSGEQGPVRQPRRRPTTRPADFNPEDFDPAFFEGPPNRGPRRAEPPATQPVDKLTLNFKDAPLDMVLDYLSAAAGYEVFKDSPVDSSKRVTVMSKQPVSRKEALVVLNAALKSNGFVAIESERELHIVAKEVAKKGSIPVHVGEDAKDIDGTNELITQVIPIRNISASKLKQDLAPLIGTDADVTANDGSNAIIITDVSINIRRVVQIISDLDRDEGSALAMRVVQLKYADASSAVKLIEAIFKSEGGGGGGQQGQPQFVNGPQGPMPAAAGGGGGERVRGAVHAAADDRTNTLVITGPAETLKVVDSILEKLDSNPVPSSILRAFPLKYADAETTSKLITSIFSPQDQNAAVPFFFRFRGGGQETENKVKVNSTFDDRTNTVIVTAPAEAMKSIEELIQKLDANPVATSDIHVFPLKNADAYSAAKLINSIFNPSSTSERIVPVFIFGEGGGNTPSKNAKVNANSDDRTNTLLVTAPAETMKIIEGVVKQLDSNPVSSDTLFIYHLRNGQAANLEIVLNTLFGNIQNGQGPQQNQQNFNGQQPQAFGSNNSSRGGSSGRSSFGSNNNNSSSGFGSNRQGNGYGRNGQGNNRQQLSPGSLQAINELTGEVFVVADTDTNSLIVTTASKYANEVRQIIGELDRPVPQVLINVLIAEVSHDNSADFGVDFSVLNKRANGNGQTYTANLGNAAQTTGLVISALEKNLSATLHALAVQGKLDVLSRPYILASDNQLSSILVGQSVPIPIDVRFDQNGNQITSVEYQDIGIILNVTPHINPDGQVILDVAPETSQLTDQTIPISSTVGAPVIARRAAQSRVGIRDGETIVIGGMMQDQKTMTINKIPILGDIPLIKYVFSRTQVSKTKTELLIFLTPHVAQRPDVLKGMSEDEMRGTRLTPHAVEPGTFDEQIRGMQRGSAPRGQPTQPVAPVFEPTPDTQPGVPQTQEASDGPRRRGTNR